MQHIQPSTVIAVLGGTFNPPHLGHIQPALQAIKTLGIPRLGVMPCKLPPHKDTQGISEQHRVRMVNALCEGHDQLYPELIELSLPAPSYTVKTLRALKQAQPGRTICFLLGEDSLYNLPTWYEWQQLTDYCHLVVMRRTTGELGCSEQVQNFVAQHQTTDSQRLLEQDHGGLYMADTALRDISSTELRALIATSQANPEHNEALSQWLDPAVINYIKQHRLYV